MSITEDTYRTGRRAAELCQQVTPWLNAPVWAPTPLEPVHNWPDPSTASELIEWIRNARDVLAEVAQQAPKSYSPGEVGRTSAADMANSRGAGDLAGHPGIPNTLLGVSRVISAERDQAAGMTPAEFALYAAEQNGMLL